MKHRALILTALLTNAGLQAQQVIVETFADNTQQEQTISGGTWSAGARPGPIGGDGRHGSFAPQLGGTWTLQADNVVGATAIFYFGDTTYEPGIDLSPLGAPGCSVYTNTVYGCYPQAAAGGASSMSWSVPNDPNLVGFEISAQSACAAADPANTLTFSTSNGLRATAGY